MKPNSLPTQFFAHNLGNILKRRSMTQRQLAEAMSVSEACVSRWINAKEMPASTRLQKISDYFGTTASSLLDQHGVEIRPINPEIEAVKELVGCLNKLLKGSGFELVRKRSN